jgi:hypothetical protein
MLLASEGALAAGAHVGVASQANQAVRNYQRLDQSQTIRNTELLARERVDMWSGRGTG